jgi:acyl transferase domain-containing protein
MIPVAVVGMAVRVPGAAGVAPYWENLLAGVESVRFFRRDELLAAGADQATVDTPNHVPARGVVDGAERCDGAFFGLSERDVVLADPQFTLLLETAWRALEDAGCAAAPADRVGVFAGAAANRYAELLRRSGTLAADAVTGLQARMGADPGFFATRIAYLLDLRGPALTVQTACSSSLVAVHLACRALAAGDCDVALAGGVAVQVPQVRGYLVENGLIESEDGHCRAFDDAATGTVGGHGAGVVVLRRLADAEAAGDRIHAVLVGTGIGNDGDDKLGFTAPSVAGQVAAATAALAEAGLDGAAVGMVECHGTGTRLGDPLELRALDRVYGRDRAGPCLIGSVKSNLGHLDAAAGVAGLVKAVLAVREAVVPPTVNVAVPNRAFDWDSSALRLCTAATPWPGAGRRVAAVSSLGLGGTNVSVLVAEPPPVPEPPRPTGPHLLLVSARTPEDRDLLAGRLADTLPGRLADVAYTLRAGRRAFPYRLAVVAGDADGAARALRGGGVRGGAVHGRALDRPEPVLLFPGQGAPVAGSAREPAAVDPRFAAALAGAAEALVAAGAADPRPLLLGPPDGVAGPAGQQSALFAVEYAYGTALLAAGVRPAAVAGHSVGEVAAACVAGVFGLAEAAALVAVRSVAGERLCPEGGMLAVAAGAEAVEPLAAAAGGAVAVVNAPDQCVVSGPVAVLDRLVAALAGRRIAARRVASGRPYHSALMAPAAAAVATALAGVPLAAPTVPLVSSVTGGRVGEEVAEPAYWAEEITAPVRFDLALATLLGPGRVFVEAGPGRILTRLARSAARRAGVEVATAAAGGWLDLIGALWVSGVDTRLPAGGRPGRKVALPGHPLHPRACPGRDAVLGQPAPTPASAPAARRGGPPPAADPSAVVVAVYSDVLGMVAVDPDRSFFELGGDSLQAIQAASRLSEVFGRELAAETLFDHPSARAVATHLTDLPEGRP